MVQKLKSFHVNSPRLSKLFSIILSILPVGIHILMFSTADAEGVAELLSSVPFSIFLLFLISSFYNLTMIENSFFGLSYWLNGVLLVLYVILSASVLFIALAVLYFYVKYSKN